MQLLGGSQDAGEARGPAQIERGDGLQRKCLSHPCSSRGRSTADGERPGADLRIFCVRTRGLTAAMQSA
jgi:hypothetical protein